MRFLPLLLLAAIGVFGRDVRVTVLATTDLHGNIYPWDYLTGKPAERGLAKVATLIDAERKANPNNLLIDVGDTIQGAALESVWQPYVRTGKLPLNVKFTGPAPTVEPMMLVMNHTRLHRNGSRAITSSTSDSRTSTRPVQRRSFRGSLLTPKRPAHASPSSHTSSKRSLA